MVVVVVAALLVQKGSLVYRHLFWERLGLTHIFSPVDAEMLVPHLTSDPCVETKTRHGNCDD